MIRFIGELYGKHLKSVSFIHMIRIFTFWCCWLLVTTTCFSQNAVERITDYAQFKKLASDPLNTNLGQTESIKLIVDTKSKKIHFINSKRFAFHFQYCVEALGYYHTLNVFNEENYSPRSNREFLLGNVNFVPSNQLYFIDLSVFDLIPEKEIVTLFKTVQANSYFGKDLRLLLNTSRLLNLKDDLSKEISVILPDDVYSGKNYQEITSGRCIGKLKIVHSLDSLKEPLYATDIVVLHGTPRYFPNVQGILLDEFQTPLSHLVILGRNRKIPIAAHKHLFSDTNLLKLNGEWVELQITENRYSLVPTKSRNYHFDNVKATALVCDTAVCTLVSDRAFSFVGAQAIGNKAYNFGILQQLQQQGNFSTPEAAFAIPFYFYLQHISKSAAGKYIDQLNASIPTTDDSLRLLLKAIRKSIRVASVDSNLVLEIRQRLLVSGFTTFRFRSSTNAEDADGFSGAGLYVSKTVDLNDSVKTIEKAIRDVWASCWTYEAFQERRFFHISDNNLAMAILVHRSFPAEKANGVVITKNVYRDGYPGISINVQVGDVSVVEPPAGVTCDQLVAIGAIEYSDFQRSVEYISTSSLTNGASVLNDEEIIRLEKAVETVKDYYWKNHLVKRSKYKTYEHFGLDLEFKLEGKERRLYLKQVRIYNG